MVVVYTHKKKVFVNLQIKYQRKKYIYKQNLEINTPKGTYIFFGKDKTYFW